MALKRITKVNKDYFESLKNLHENNYFRNYKIWLETRLHFVQLDQLEMTVKKKQLSGLITNLIN